MSSKEITRTLFGGIATAVRKTYLLQKIKWSFTFIHSRAVY
jgi:hypothetical protein